MPSSTPPTSRSRPRSARPRYHPHDKIKTTLDQSFGDKDAFAIFFKTVFHFKEFDASGFLFIISDQTSLKWIKSAAKGYLSQYE